MILEDETEMYFWLWNCQKKKKKLLSCSEMCKGIMVKNNHAELIVYAD